jgi:hypothetical protein
MTTSAEENAREIVKPGVDFTILNRDERNIGGRENGAR